MKYDKIKLDIYQIEEGNYHVFVNALVSGMPCRLLLDTGASKTVFDEQRVLSFVRQSAIKNISNQSVGLGVESMETKVTQLRDFRLGKILLKKWEIAVLPIGHVNQTYHLANIPAIDGVLGSDMLMHLKAVINYHKSHLKIKLEH